MAAVAVDLSSPWLMQKSIEKWTSALEGAILQQMSQIDPQKRNTLYQSVKNHLLDYEEPVRYLQLTSGRTDSLCLR